jgi:hypothetical protein
VGREVVEHDPDPLGLRIMEIDQVAHAFGEVAGGALVSDLDPAPGSVRVEKDEQVDGAVAAIFIVEAFQPARRGRDRLAGLADQLGRALVEAHHRPLWIVGLGVEVEHILHAGDIGAIDLRDTPHVLAPVLQMVLGQAPAHRLT